MKALLKFIHFVTGLCREVSRAFIEADSNSRSDQFDSESDGADSGSVAGIVKSALRIPRKAQLKQHVPQHGPVTCHLNQEPIGFDDVFSETNIIKCLLKERQKLRKIRHKRQFYHQISSDEPHGDRARPDMAKDLDGLFPPRREWSKYHPSRKSRSKHRAEDLNQVALENAVFSLLEKNPDLPWVRKLRERVATIQAKALQNIDPTIAPPLIIGVRKSPESFEYRPVSMYSLDDNIVQKLTARYLNLILDFCFSSSSLAYRCMRSNAEPPLNRDTALLRILEFANRHPLIFVGEADLRNFMDCIGHGIAYQSLLDLIDCGRRLRPDLQVDPRALRIFKVCLESYSYQNDVQGRALPMLRKKDRNGIFPWPEDLLRTMHDSEKLDQIGVPQGGALSCFITNVVLHAVDLEVNSMHVPGGHEILYLRYCDDMLILATNLELCRKAMDTYLSLVKGLRLPVHEPVDVTQPQADHGTGSVCLDAKSKNPYAWTAENKGGIPWIQFLGFEIRYDGEVRIRQKSIDKQCGKITDEANNLIKTIKPYNRSSNGNQVYAPGLRMHPLQILDRAQLKFIAMSVGKMKLGQKSPSCAGEIKSMCWANGYRILWDVSYDPSQLKKLDRHRDLQWKRVRRALKPLLERDAAYRHQNPPLNKPRYYGSPFSYHGQFSVEYGHQKETAKPITGCLRKSRIMIKSLFQWIRLH